MQISTQDLPHHTQFTPGEFRQHYESQIKIPTDYPVPLKLPSDGRGYQIAGPEIANKYHPLIRAKGYYIVVKPYTREEKTANGTLIPQSARDEDQHHSVACQVIDIGPTAYTDPKFSGGLSWAQIGDWVVVPRATGTRLSIWTEETVKEDFRIIREDDIIAIVSDPRRLQIKFTTTKF